MVSIEKIVLGCFFFAVFFGVFRLSTVGFLFFNGAQPTGSRPLRKSAATVSFFFCAFFLRVSGAKKQQQQQHKKKRKKKKERVPRALNLSFLDGFTAN